MNHDICILDPASGGKDRFTYCTAGWRVDSTGKPFVQFENMGGFESAIVRALGGREVMRRIIEIGRQAGARMFVSDQRDRLTTEDAFRAAQVQYRIYDWTAGENAPGSKAPAVEHVRRWLQERRLALPAHETLKRELRAFEEKIAPQSGRFTFGVRGNGHDDFVALLITAAMADMDLQMRRPDGTGGGGYQGPLPPPITMTGGILGGTGMPSMFGEGVVVEPAVVGVGHPGLAWMGQQDAMGNGAAPSGDGSPDLQGLADFANDYASGRGR
jgi:hypothetical protein